ncbi:hypothetical protein MNBD_CHLOROFLEXI01-268 [hydrothermal vent metagenome]|uniref:AAA+ ATPase domain-containing protein n=1 Tax=hydrothermal vent metagenome TaxID=652676 RepID=A0A3B0UT29_9ZZZZ
MFEKQPTKQFIKDIHIALKNWYVVHERGTHFLDYLTLVQEQRKQTSISDPASLRFATNKILLAGLKSLQKRNAQAANIIERRFIDEEKIGDLSPQFQVNEDKFKRMQKAAIAALAHTIHEQELKLRKERITLLESHLETKGHTKLFGIEALADTIYHHLSDPKAHEIVMLTGIGGIGKTSLSNHIARKIIRRFYFECVVWISVTNQSETGNYDPARRFQRLTHQLTAKLLPHLPASTRPQQRQDQLRQLLKRTPYLIVVDNLELPSDMSYLLSNLLELTTPGKFLLTSRTQPAGHSGVLNFVLNELELASSLALIRHHAGEIGIHDLVDVDDASLMPIYEAVGGNPFALKLLIGLAQTRSLPDILSDFQTGHSATELLYNKIFWQAWHSLSASAKIILTIMPLAPEAGMSPKQLLTYTALSKEALWPAINELASRSLLEVRGTVWERHYGIHHLTKTFILSQIIK